MGREPREEAVEIIGTVTMVRVIDPRVAWICFDGQEIEAPFKPEDEDIITSALKQHATVKVRLQGRGLVSARGKVQKVIQVEKLTLLPAPEPPLDPDAKPIWEVIDEIMKDVPDEVLEKLPRDGSINHDHYIYGLPKREP